MLRSEDDYMYEERSRHLHITPDPTPDVSAALRRDNRLFAKYTTLRCAADSY